MTPKTDLRTLPRVNSALYDEIRKILGTLPDKDFLKISQPVFQLPSISAFLRRSTNVRGLLRSKWFLVYKPELLIDIHLQHLTNMSEAAIKHLLRMVEAYCRKVGGTRKTNPSEKLGSVVEYLQTHLEVTSKGV